MPALDADNVVSNLAGLGEHLVDVFISPASAQSLPSLVMALAVAVGATILRRRSGRRGARLTVWLRALFPRRIIAAASTRADLGLAFLNIFVTGLLIGWALLSAGQVGDWTKGVLVGLFGAPAASPLPGWALSVIATLTLWLAYEAGYWLEHYTSHKIKFFWAFHQTHHTAEVLTPLTVWRVHPVESLKFANIAAVVTGATSGLLAWGFGGAAHAYLVNGANLILVLLVYPLAHLQHSHVWLATTGVWGRLLLSPAHHQVHHSADPVHFGRNLGSSLAVFDWLFGTLYVPKAKPEGIVFGLGSPIDRPHSVTGALIAPFGQAAETLLPKPQRAAQVHSLLAETKQ